MTLCLKLLVVCCFAFFFVLFVLHETSDSLGLDNWVAWHKF